MQDTKSARVFISQYHTIEVPPELPDPEGLQLFSLFR